MKSRRIQFSVHSFLKIQFIERALPDRKFGSKGEDFFFFHNDNRATIVTVNVKEEAFTVK